MESTLFFVAIDRQEECGDPSRNDDDPFAFSDLTVTMMYWLAG
jgi:hypothetical protein